VIGHLVILRRVDKRRWLGRLSSCVHYTTKEEDKRLVGGILVGPIRMVVKLGNLCSGWVMVRFSGGDPEFQNLYRQLQNQNLNVNFTTKPNPQLQNQI